MKPVKFICPLIVVSDIAKSRYFYEKFLNQTVKYDFEENIQFSSGLSIHLKSHYEKLINRNVISGENNSFELFFESEDLDSFEAFLLENNIDFIHRIRTEPWNQRVLRFYDPDKHIIEVGEPMQID